MAKQVVALEASFDTSQAEGSVKSLKAQMREAQAEVSKMADKFGETSSQAAKAAKKAAELKDKIGDAKALTEAFNPDAKFKALSGALSVVAGGFAAVQGAMGLMGAESKDVEKTMLKVQSAMALATGLNTLGEAGDAWKRLKASAKSYSIVQNIVTTATKLWNAAMAANPIGAIVVAITALIAGIVALTAYFISNASAAKANAKAVEENGKALDKQSKQLERNNQEYQKAADYKLAMLKASGASAKAIRAEELNQAALKIAYEISNRTLAENTLEKNKNYLATLKATDADDDAIKKQQETTNKSVEEYNKQNKNVQAAVDERTAIYKKQNIEIATEQTNANKKSADDIKTANDKAKADRDAANKERLAADKQLQQERKNLAQEEALNNIKDEDERAKKKLEFDYINAKQVIEQSKASDIEKYQSLQALYTKFWDDRNALDDTQKAKTLKKETETNAETFKIISDARINAMTDENLKSQEIEALRYQDEIDKQLELLNNKEITDIEYKARREAIELQHQTNINGIIKTASEKEIADKEKAEQAKRELNNIAIDSAQELVGIIAGLGEKNKGLQKAALIANGALSIAQIVNNTNVGSSKEVATKGIFGLSTSAILYAKMGISIASVLAATAKGLSALGASGGVSSSASGGGGGGATAAPVQPQVQSTTLDQNQVNQMSSATSRAFVLESDVSGNQERIQRLNRAARIN